LDAAAGALNPLHSKHIRLSSPWVSRRCRRSARSSASSSRSACALRP